MSQLGIEIDDVVDLRRYCITDLGSTTARRLIQNCQAQLSDTGLCLLPDFITPNALARMQDDAGRLAGDAYYTEHWRATPNGSDASATSTLHVATRASMGSIAYSQIDRSSPLRALYESGAFVEFVNAVLDDAPLYTTADSIVSCMMTVMHETDELGWHYDPNDGVVSLLITQPAAGGEFEFAPRIRAPSTQAEENERAVIAGRYEKVLRVELSPGTLSLFNGRNALHRVTPVKGDEPRVIALFNFASQPGYQFDEHIRQRFFGRVA